MAYTYGTTALDDKVNYNLYQKNFDMLTVKSIYKIARRSGKKLVGLTQNARNITVVVRVQGSSRADLEAKLDTLYQGLNTPGQHLSLHALDTRYFVADCAGATTELAAIKGGGMPGSGPTWADVTIAFICANPYAYANSTSTVDSGVVSTIVAGGGTYTYYQEVSGTGTVFNRPQVRVTQSGTSVMWTSLTIQQLVNNQQIIVTSGLPVANGDYVDFFCDTTATNGQIVQLNSSGTPLPFTGLFPVLEPIPTAWKFVIAAPSRPSIRVVWTLTSRYLT